MLTASPVDLIAERVDVAVRVGNLRDSNLVAVPLLQVRYHVVASPSWLRAQAKPPRFPTKVRVFIDFLRSAMAEPTARTKPWRASSLAARP